MTEVKNLSKKQQKVLDLLNTGKTPIDIARRMKIGVSGVYGHMRRIEEKGHEVPRRGAGRPSASPSKGVAPQATGPISAIDEGIRRLAALAEARLDDITNERAQISQEEESLATRKALLNKEWDALLKRREALTGTL